MSCCTYWLDHEVIEHISYSILYTLYFMKHAPIGSTMKSSSNFSGAVLRSTKKCLYFSGSCEVSLPIYS